MQSKEMPPPPGGAVSEKDLQAVADWIKSLKSDPVCVIDDEPGGDDAGETCHDEPGCDS